DDLAPRGESTREFDFSRDEMRMVPVRLRKICMVILVDFKLCSIERDRRALRLLELEVLPPKIGALWTDTAGLQDDLDLRGLTRKIEKLRRAADLISFFVEADCFQRARIEPRSEV